MLGKQCATELYPSWFLVRKKIKVQTMKSKIFKIIEGKRSEQSTNETRQGTSWLFLKLGNKNVSFCVLIYSKFSITKGFLKEAE